MGLDEYLGGDGVAVVEWPERCPEAWPETCLLVTLTPVDEQTREITLRPAGGFRALPGLTGPCPEKETSA